MRPPCTPAPTPTPINQPNNSNVLFVSRIADACTEEQLRGSVLSTFGSIVSVRLCNQDKSRGNSAYAFVTYQNAAEANAAVEAKPNGGSLFCGTIKIADPPRSKVKFDALEERNAQRWDEVTRMIAEHKPNVVLHVNASHCDRMVDYLSISRKDRPGISYEHADKVSFVSVLPCNGSTNLKLILLTFRGDPEVLVRDISEKAFLTTALNRCFIVEQGISIATTGVDEVSQKAIELLKKRCANRDTNKFANEEQGAAIRLRVQSYPSKLQQAIADGIEQSNAALRSAVMLDPVNFNTILSVVRVHTDEAPPSKSKRSTVGRGLYLLGLSDKSTFFGNLNARSRKRRHETSVIEDDKKEEERTEAESYEICRAYHKLEEAFDRYKPDPSKVSSSVAMDVGAAPGGWTKYLAENVAGCQQVYSIDPAKLSPDVLNSDKVVHIPRQIQDALPDMEKDMVGIYVSDMCLSVMEKQLEYMLMTKRKGVLKPNCFFVLTLKCILGHAKEAHDEQAQEVSRRLTDGNLADDVAIIHLFNNRSGERTLLGYLR